MKKIYPKCLNSKPSSNKRSKKMIEEEINFQRRAMKTMRRILMAMGTISMGVVMKASII
jgi:hypothetical protein